MPLEQQPPTAEEIAGAISAMRDSVGVINAAIAGTSGDDTFNVIARNVSHLELMMSKEEISGSGEDLSDVTAAIDAGNQYMAENPPA